MKNKSSLQIIKAFFEEYQVNIEIENYLNDIITKSTDYTALPNDIIKRIIGDSYNYANPLVKELSNQITKKYDIILGRVQKNQLKKYIDYENDNDFNIFFNLLNENIFDKKKLRQFCDIKIKKFKPKRKQSLKQFWKNFLDALKNNKRKRIKDYLVFLYSRLLSINENKKISLDYLFLNEASILKEELNKEDYKKFEKYCSYGEKNHRFEVIKQYNKKYLEILEKNENYEKQASLIYLPIDQNLFNKFNSKNLFYSYLYSIIEKSYNEIQNHKALVIRIRNIFANNINIKWEVYSYLTIYAEKFKDEKLNQTYYHPEDICADLLEYKFDISLSDEDRKILKKYYKKNKSEILETSNLFSNTSVQKTIKFFEKGRIGFSYIDCFILNCNRKFRNSTEIDFIKNKNELLLIFHKNQVDERKIPCPVCGSLKISGNSYPEIGIKSWECKNPICSARSKTNRGKRYSKKTIMMQEAVYDFTPQNRISKDFQKKWRKDYVENWTLNLLYKMLVKFYTFVGDNIIGINVENDYLFEEIIERQDRKAKCLDYNRYLNFDQFDRNLFIDFMEKDLFLKQFIYNKKENKTNKNTNELPINNSENSKRLYFINDDCSHALSKFDKNTIHNIITSPPYYNVRKYSQWKNLYNYLNDMYSAIKLAKDILIPGGVFFYNIGDIYDNEKVIVKSTMGMKRIPLGAYIILLFKKAGFILLDNIIWYKGEPQSNRHKNDGNYVPFYQRPTNCYEHMFIFKKDGNLKLANDSAKNLLTSNIQKFNPVVKIGIGGVNNYGHTAPFPEFLPLLSILCFTNPGDYVLDPYSGSGTTALVAFNKERTGIGIEIKKEYINLSLQFAKKRNLKVYLITRDKKNNFLYWKREKIFEPKKVIKNKKIKQQTLLEKFFM